MTNLNTPAQQKISAFKTAAILLFCTQVVGCYSKITPDFELLTLDREKLTLPDSRLTSLKKAQPGDFDPLIKPWKKYKQSGTPSQLYCNSPDCEPPHMNINGWVDEGERKIVLPAPFDLDFYEFGVASSSDFILNLRKDGKRQALYRDVISFSHFSMPTGGKLAIQTMDRNVKIADIESGSVSLLPHARCTEDLGYFSNGLLITHSNKNSAENDIKRDQYETEFCIWDPDGNLKGHLIGKLPWLPYSEYALYQYGILPGSTETFFALNNFKSQLDGSCRLVLQDLRNQDFSTGFEIPEKLAASEYDNGCLKWELELNGISLRSKFVRYRQKDGAWKIAPATN